MYSKIGDRRSPSPALQPLPRHLLGADGAAADDLSGPVGLLRETGHATAGEQSGPPGFRGLAPFRAEVSPDAHAVRGPRPPVRPQPGLPRPLHAGLMWAMWLLAGGYVASLALHALDQGPDWDSGFGTFVDGWLGLLTVWMPAVVCWLSAWRTGFRRTEIILAAAAVTAFAVGDTYYVLMSWGGRELPFPSPADVGYLLVYPLLLAALAVTVSRHARGVTLSVWLDCAVGSLGAGAVMAVVLDPVLNSATDQLSPVATVVAVAPPLFDLVLIAAVAGIAALRVAGIGKRWALLGVALLVFTAADAVYGIQVANGSYVQGTPLDAGWALGLALMAAWVDSVTDGHRTSRIGHHLTGAPALVISSVATISGLVVLVLGCQMPVSRLALVLAVAALLASGIRAQLAARLLEKMAHQRLVAAGTDELTSLPNRRTFYSEGQARLADPRRRRQALLMLDLDKFKEVNDSLGHHAGDELLVEVGTRLRESLRGDDLLARLGGDEFAVLLDDAGHDEALDAAARLCAAIGEPLTVEHTSLRTRASIGVALFPDDGPDLSALLRKADIAMYRAKTSQRAHHVYSSDDDVDAAVMLRTVQELRTALKFDQFVMHYQPKVDLDTREVNSVEALVRWDHPTRGLLFPDAFLEVVDDSGLMPALNRAVLAKALDQAAEWHRDGHPLTVAVNLSASSLADAELPNEIAAMIAARGLRPSAVQLEITEEFVMRDVEQARKVLAAIRAAGVKISVDDFGTGYNSLACLRDLPVDELKLDRSFVMPMSQNPRTAALVSSTIELAHALGLRVVAEGVETAGSYGDLTSMGCDQAQGYYMSKPVPAAELKQWLKAWRASNEVAYVGVSAG